MQFFVLPQKDWTASFMPRFVRRFPNEHGYHAALFVKFAPNAMSTGE